MSDLECSVLVTGGAKRIGRMIAIDLANNGWRVAVHFNKSKVDAELTVEQIEKGGGRAIACSANLLNESEVVDLIANASEHLGPISCLINNASVFEEDSAMTETRLAWDRHMEVNLRAPFLLSQQLARQIPKGKTGNIINIIDQRVWNLTSDFTSYTISKVGLWGVTRILGLVGTS